METKTRMQRFPELDGLRGLACLWVFVHHFFQFPVHDSSRALSQVMLGILEGAKYGGSGVDVFFVLSGFLITCLLLVDRSKTNYFHNFYWKRVLRILPVYFIHLLLAAWFIPNSGGYLLLSLVFLVNFSSVFRVSVVGVAWTLSIEEQFYLLWPHFVRRLRIVSLYYVAFALVGCSIVLRLGSALVRHSMSPGYTFYRCDGLGLGAILALQWYSSEERPPFVEQVLRVLHSGATIVCMMIVGCVAVFAPIDALIKECLVITTVTFSTYRLIRILVFREGKFKAIDWLASPALRYMGAISYALYMFHPFVLVYFNGRYGPVNSDTYGLTAIRFLACLAVSVAASALSRYVLETPAQNLRRFVLRLSQTDVIASARLAKK